MRVRIIEQISLCKYKGHFIRKVEDEFHNVLVFIDKPSGDYENAPLYMRDEDFHYTSVEDAKRAIRGEQPKWVSIDGTKDKRFLKS